MRGSALGLALMALVACDDEPAVRAPDDTGTGCDPAEAARPVTLRRLNRAEYDNTVRDLLGTATLPAEDFPDDNIGYGFDNIGDVLAVSPLLFEKFVFAAEGLVAEALAWPRLEPTKQTFEAEDVGQTGAGEPYGDREWDQWAAGMLTVPLEVLGEGDYGVTVRAFAKQAGDEVARMAVVINSAEVRVFDVEATEGAAADYTVRLPLTPGDHTIGVRFVNEFNDPTEADPERRVRRLILDRIVVEGPLGAAATAEPEARKAILTCTPEAPSEDASCARQVLRQFASRAWRAPVEPEQLEILVEVVTGFVERGEDWEAGVQAALVATLLSPRFLARFEVPPEPGEVRWLDDYELASRLSYFVWSSMPDAALLADAQAGRLVDPEVLGAHALRMLDDSRSHGFVKGFAAQWLNMREIANADPDYERFPEFDEELRLAMRGEMELVFEELLVGERSMMDLVEADFTWLDDRLARHYGLSESGEPGFRRIDLPPGGQRFGLLTMAGWLMSNSHRLRTSPVRRGKWVLSSLLCVVTPEPPPIEPPLPDEDPGEVTGTMRERFEAHRRRPECATCHKLIDPIGFALENYDAVGAWREADEGGVIDSTGTMPDGQAFSGPQELAAILKTDPAAPRCMVRKLFTYALGRGPEPTDQCTLDRLTERFVRSGHVFKDLMVGIVTSEAFRARANRVVEDGS